jgi:hypothetical protein
MTDNPKGVKCRPDPEALRRTGWRPPLLPGEYQDLVFSMFSRPEFAEASTRAVLEAALRAFATKKELEILGDDGQ